MSLPLVLLIATNVIAAPHEEPRVLVGHTTPVTSVAFSPDGKTLASGDEGGIIRVWDTQTGHERKKLTGHTGPVAKVAFLSNDELVSGGGPTTEFAEARVGEVLIWDIATGTRRELSPKPIDAVRSLAVSADGKYVAAAGQRDLHAYVWQLGSKVLAIPHTERNQEPVTALAFDRGHLLMARGPGFIRYQLEPFALIESKYVRSFRGEDVRTIVIDSRKEIPLIIVLGGNKGVRVLDPAREKEKKENILNSFGDRVVHRVCFDPGGRILIRSRRRSNR